jgi:hypothetical protein
MIKDDEAREIFGQARRATHVGRRQALANMCDDDDLRKT